ncbi:MAG TPA: hypothetical protein VNO33_16315 [Kofleriaceae bacterium]|nr:hypothetical protein [Kofleriaceae bacterium]
MDPREGKEREVAQLAGARMPADHGLASLGLIMQLGGSVFAAYMGLLAVMSIFAPGGDAVLVFFACAAGALRSVFHRAAGSALVHGSHGGVFRPIQVYVGTAVAQTVLTLLVVRHVSDLPGSLMVGLALALLAWPMALLVFTTRPRMRAMAAQSHLPMSEDLGFEGSAALMMLLGLIGTLVASFMLYAGLKLPGGTLANPHQMLLVGVFGMLLARSILHATAGIKGTRGADPDTATSSASRYYTFGVVSSVITGGALFILMVMSPSGGLHPIMLLFVGLAVYLLLSWPLILRRFYTDRNYSALLAGPDAPSHRRAPDAGLTAVGWLLLGLGLLQLALTLPSALFGKGELSLDLFSLLGTLQGDDAGMAAYGRSGWWSVGTALAQVWAGLELVHMTDRHRMAATVYGAVASLVTLYVMWPQLQDLEAALGATSMGDYGAVASSFHIAISLVLPIGTIILANRNLHPTARARVRSHGE